ncbi:plasmid transfer protein [Hafnia psychrotolerans]|uniref:Plasmid transfer protein n=1 Tax=Hafnia psychrotolerans TaxID=1477018 RepID=A0ABQ1GJM2_9GAMM|nr:plasmid transfer protein [Hafnia psychrotolerans]GGA45102.1 plasmid transfer protein [Hafnia psychrotolerans]
MTPETLPEQEPTSGPGSADSTGEPHSTPARRPVFPMNNPQWLKRVAIGVAAIVIIAPGILSLVLYQQLSTMDIRLNSLEAAFRSGQLSQLSSSVATLEKHVAEQDERFALKEGVVKGMSTLGNTLDGKIAGQNQKIGQLESQIDEQKKALQYELDNGQASALEFSSLKATVDALKVSQAQKPPAAALGGAVTSGKKHKTSASKKSLRSARTVPLAAPFILTGIEQRGGQNFAVIAPQGATNLSQMQLLSPGDSAWGWQLRSIEGNQAVFSVNGIPQRLSAQ